MGVGITYAGGVADHKIRLVRKLSQECPQGSALRRAGSIGIAGFDAEVELRDLEVQVLGTTAIAVGYISGTLNLPGGMAIEGNWRYSETRVLDGGVWKTIQFHFSELQGSGGD